MRRSFLLIFLLFGLPAFSDTALDGFWNLNSSLGAICSSGRKPSEQAAAAFFKKYGNQQMHLSDMHMVWYLTLPHGEVVAVAERLSSGGKPNEYYIRRPELTVPDIQLSLSSDRLQYTSIDTEFGMCQGERYHVYFDYLRLNP